MSACYPPHWFDNGTPSITYYRIVKVGGRNLNGMARGEHVVTHALVDLIEAALNTRSAKMQATYTPHVKALRNVAK